MFDENENIFPTKPVLIEGEVRNKGAKLFALSLLFVFFVINYFPESYILLIELLLVLVFHEFGHYMMMRIYKRKTQGLFFMSFLTGLTQSFKPTRSKRKHVIINMMGPLPGIIIGCILFYLAISDVNNFRLIELAVLFLFINILNLFPLDLFDGGRILEVLFFSKNDQLKMYFVLVSSLLMIGAGFWLSFYPLVIFGFLMGLKVRGHQKSMYLHRELEEEQVDFEKHYSELTDKEYWKIRAVFLTNNPRLKEMIPSGHTLWENEKLLMEQVRQLLRIDLKSDLSLAAKMLILLVLVVLIVCPLLFVFSHAEIIEWYLNNANV